ncbi:hypothetical protein [Erwinia mallotivora]|uniref:hypothetical protein n=1 Tax=Erwinia mallotivora TaxID=69222 RepID=UPI0021BFC645|nr:hypothetical protein [Erwinia mallotivora]
MPDDFTLYQNEPVVLIVYYFISLSLSIAFYIFKYKKKVALKRNKVVWFFLIWPFIIFQYAVFRYGLDGLSDYFSIKSDDSLFLRISALLFAASYLFFLPVRESKKTQGK